MSHPQKKITHTLLIDEIGKLEFRVLALPRDNYPQELFDAMDELLAEARQVLSINPPNIPYEDIHESLLLLRSYLDNKYDDHIERTAMLLEKLPKGTQYHKIFHGIACCFLIIGLIALAIKTMGMTLPIAAALFCHTVGDLFLKAPAQPGHRYTEKFKKLNQSPFWRRADRPIFPVPDSGRPPVAPTVLF